MALVDQLEGNKLKTSGTGVGFPVVEALVVLAPCLGLEGDVAARHAQGPPAIGALKPLIEPGAQS